MDKEAIVKALETATPCQLKALADVLEGKKTEEPKVEAPKVAEAPKAEAPETKTPKVAEAVKTPTFEELLASAPADMQESFRSMQAAAAARKADTIKALKATKRCSFTDEELNAKSQKELDSLVALAGAPAVDYSGQGAPRAAEAQAEAVPAPPDMAAALRAARGQK